MMMNSLVISASEYGLVEDQALMAEFQRGVGLDFEARDS